ncbi:MAG: RraA family protein, partial [Alphaproteobacteria bacterium]|nr:RraA family protein [Alphaproteobacteria bacterium]
ITPASCDRNGPGTVGLPVMAGGLRVESGDVVVGNYDGVVVVPQAQLAAVAAKLKTVLKLEAELERKVKAGLDVPDFYKALVKKGAVREVK